MLLLLRPWRLPFSRELLRELPFWTSRRRQCPERSKRGGGTPRSAPRQRAGPACSCCFCEEKKKSREPSLRLEASGKGKWRSEKNNRVVSGAKKKRRSYFHLFPLSILQTGLSEAPRRDVQPRLGDAGKLLVVENQRRRVARSRRRRRRRSRSRRRL